MKPRTIVTLVILAFVAVSVGYLVVKEVRAARRPGVATGGLSGAAPTTVASAEKAPDGGRSLSAADREVLVTYYYNTSKR